MNHEHRISKGMKNRWLSRALPLVLCAAIPIFAVGQRTAAATEVLEVPDVAPESESDAAKAEIRKQAREAELAALSRDIELSTDAQGTIEREIALIDRDRETLNARIISTADSVKRIETDLTDTERRLGTLGENEDAIRQSLNARRGVLAEVLAGLQKLGRRPPPALAVRPDDALSAVRTAILLNAVMPELKLETEALAADLAELSRLRTSIAAEKDRLRGDALRLVEEQSRLELLLSAKRKEREATAQNLAAEKQKAQELAEKAASLKELISDLEKEIASAQKAAEEARLAALNKANTPADMANPFSDAGRLAPAVAFVDVQGKLPFPVSGALLRDYGEEDEFGNLTEGQSISSRVGSTVTSPADGWVVYAGPFRSFGQLLILNMGDGYHVLLAGMDRIDAELGQFVLAGEPVGVMGTTKWASASTIGLGSTQPVLYVEFRKDGRAIDPAPWWESTEKEKARG
ncbi:murein hydrolase activator EnvC family protein [Roseibium sediminis]|uniref:murein hydrolase activator EnvC family protein n=1 Tax=Roseibium sediminis TaxID=1775174 RepID=UPI001FCA59AC|nr:peptidoglycan DD-metalloendopeptidase family protein [Roseibium sediminis]